MEGSISLNVPLTRGLNDADWLPSFSESLLLRLRPSPLCEHKVGTAVQRASETEVDRRRQVSSSMVRKLIQEAHEALEDAMADATTGWTRAS